MSDEEVVFQLFCEMIYLDEENDQVLIALYFDKGDWIGTQIVHLAGE